MELTQTQKNQLKDNGFVVIPQAVPQLMTDKALHAINMSLGQEGIDPAKLPILRAQSYCPELGDDPVVVDLFRKTPLADLTESLLGEGNAQCGHAQIALRFPIAQDPPRAPGWHIDGIPTSTNGVPPGGLASFTMLVAVLLSDVPHENMGNFTVWPGSHQVIESFCREHGGDSLLSQNPQLEMAPQQIVGRKGDAVICHFQLAHGIAPNVSPHIRYTTFFRLKHPAHESHKVEALSDLWLEWPGLSGDSRQRAGGS